MKYIFLNIVLIFAFTQMLSSQNNKSKIEGFLNKGISYHHSNKDSAYYYYEKTISLANNENNISYILKGFQYLINANGYYYDLKNYSLNIEREDYLLKYDKRLDTFSSIKYYRDYILFDKGNYNYKIKQYNTAKRYFKKLYNKIDSIPEKNKTKDDIAMLYGLHSFLGLIYKHTNKYELATNFCENGIALMLKHRDSVYGWESRINNLRKTLSQVYFEKKEFKKANEVLEKVLIFYKKKSKNSKSKNSILSTFVLSAKNNIKQKNYKKTIELLNESELYYNQDNPFANEVGLLFGDAYLGLKNYSKSETFYNNSLQKTIAYRNNKKHQDLATINARLGKLYIKQKKIDQGLQYYQLALIQLEKDFNDTTITNNPNPKKVTSKTVLISILKEKLEALFNAYQSTKNLTYLKNAHKTSKIIIKTLDVLRPEFESKLDKQFLITEAYPSIQKMIAITYELYEKTGDNNYIKDAFYFMEKSKSILLLEAQRNSEATKYGGVPKNIISQEQQFRANISHLEQELFKSKLTDNQPLTDTLFSIKNNYLDFLTKIEKEYPNYYALKYKSGVISFNETKQLLHKNQALLNYLTTKEDLYIIVIDTKNSAFFKLPFNENTKNTIKNLYQKSSKLNINDNSIYKDSYLVYKAILEPVLLKTNATDLIILTDDILNYIPFDALNTSDKEITYLLNTHSISYASSVTLLQEHNKKSRIKSNNLLVFAPKFSGKSIINHERTDNLNPLLYNTKEAQNISKYFNSMVYNDNEATINNFKEEMGSYNLIHFATHASANDEFPDYSYLAFSNDSTTSNLLYVKDLYNYKINADLVTLSACQTGVGKLQKGEGMISLARAFNYAGVPAIVTTLWKINDQSTSEIMTYFYKNLSNGLNKKEALRQAKITYLNSNNDPLLNHPYYWSGIVLTGNTMPITTINYFLWISLGIVILLLVFFIVKKFK